MTAIACARLPQVEASRDGRLEGAERDSFERHFAVCADCRDEARKLDRLAELLKGTECATEPNELASRRRRQQLLRDADRAVITEGSRPNRAIVVGALVLAAVVLLFVGRTVVTRHAPVAAAPSAAPIEFASVHATEGARYKRVRDGVVERIELLDGELAIAVRHVTGDEHVVVKLPDGELEDLGTRFIVVVQSDHTERVVVQEGLVVLRLRGRAPIHIAAGGSWAREIPPPAVVESAPSAACSTAAPTLTTPAPKPKPTVTDPTADELKAAMSAYRGGDHRVAAAKLAAFVNAHPSDPRSEDAAYVRIIALQRAGDPAAARVAAKDYLARYPNGFRKPEVEGMLAKD